MPELTHIIYAEDDPDIQLLGTMVLETVGGFTVTVCNNGAEVLEALKQVTPQLALLDRMMPDMDGLSTARAIHELTQHKDIPVIFLTASADAEEIRTSLENGVIGVIAKPFDPMELCDSIRTIWNNHFAKVPA